MKSVSLANAKAHLSDYIRECENGQPVVITRNGKAVAVLVSADDDFERLVLTRSARFQAMLERSERSIDAGKGLTRDQFWKTVADRARKGNGKRGRS